MPSLRTEERSEPESERGRNEDCVLFGGNQARASKRHTWSKTLGYPIYGTCTAQNSGAPLRRPKRGDSLIFESLFAAREMATNEVALVWGPMEERDRERVR